MGDQGKNTKPDTDPTNQLQPGHPRNSDVAESDGKEKWTLESFLRKKFVASGVPDRLIEKHFKNDSKPMLVLRLLTLKLHELGVPVQRLKEVGIGLLVIMVLATIAFFVPTKFFGRAAVKEEARPIVEDVDVDLEIELLSDLQPLADAETAVIQGEVEKRNAKIESLRELGKTTETQRLTLQRIELEMQTTLVLAILEDRIEPEAERVVFNSLVSSSLKSGDESLALAAKYAVCVVDAKTFSMNPTAENGAKVDRSLSENRNGYLESPERLNEVLNLLVFARRQNLDNKNARDCVDKLAKIILESGEPANRDVGRNAMEFNAFADFRLANLEPRVRRQLQGAVEDLQGAIDQLDSQPEVMLFRWKQLVRSAEAFVSISEMDRFEKAASRLSSIAKALPESDSLQQDVASLLERQMDRINSAGKSFEVAGDCFNEDEQLEELIGGYTVIAYADRSKLSMSVLSQLAQGSLGREFKTIVAFKEGDLPKDPRQIPLLSRKLWIAAEDSSRKLFSQFPVDFYPHLVMLDENQKIVSTNLYPFQVPEHIASLKLAKRKEKLSAAELAPVEE